MFQIPHLGDDMDDTTVSFIEAEKGIEKNLESMMNRANSVSSYLNRNLFRQIQKAQMTRWQTEGASEGFSWEPLDEKYLAYKRKKYANSPGAGSITLVATGKLQLGALGRDSNYYYKTVTNTRFIFGINTGELPYALYPGQVRPYMKFSDEHVADMKRGIRDFIVKHGGFGL